MAEQKRMSPEADAVPADTAFGLDSERTKQVVAALEARRPDDARELVQPLHVADLADLFDQVTPDQRRLLVAALHAELDPQVLTEIDETVREDVVHELAPDELAAAVTELDSDDAVDLLEDLDAAERREILEAVPAEERAAIEAGLAYPESTAGRLMQHDLVAIPAYWTIGQTIDFMREDADLPAEFYEIFVVDPAHKPIGTVPLHRAMCTKRPVEMADIMDTNPIVIPALMDQEEAAYLFQQYDLTSAPVADTEGRLVGVVMIDDIVDVIHEEHEEDLMHLGGVGATDALDAVLTTTRKRFSWLLVNLGTAIIASIVIAIFDATIEKIVALAILMPIVASMGGNAGTQTLTVTVRALATKELTAANAARLINKEMIVGLLNGVLFAMLIGVLAALWFTNPGLGAVMAAAMVINMVIAGLSGILIPLGLTRLGFDPALAASIFVTTVTDVVGFATFLGLAAWLLL